MIAAAGLLTEDAEPRITSTRADWPYIRVVTRPPLGQTLEDWQRACEALRMGMDAARIRIEPAGVRDVLVDLTIFDSLTNPSYAAVGSATESPSSVTVGVREDGMPWSLPIGPHTLVAGSSGSGKGSVFWSFAFALAPRVPGGTVRLHGIDLKGGMEVLMGDALFSSVATSPADAVALLEFLVDQMKERTRKYAGVTRAHVPTPAEPLEVVMIDELAALTAYCNDRDLQRRCEAAINLLCSQGRAPGFVVFACLQDPRKEVIPSRGLFTQMIGLRLKDANETAMVLGEFALDSGAHCHRIPRNLPGVGYVWADDLTHPVRVRASYADDDAIRAVAREFRAVERMEIPALAQLPERRPASRRLEVQP